MSTMPQWPEKAAVSAFGSQFTLEEVIAVAGYEHRRAEAAMARLRVAVEALTAIADQKRWDEDGIMWKLPCKADLSEHAMGAIAAIGTLPPAEGA
jgi:hypothetical protein